MSGSRFNTPESEEYRKRKQQAQEEYGRWRETNRIFDTDGVFKVITKSRKIQQQSNNNSSSNSEVHTAAMPHNEWIPGYCIAWSDDTDSKAILEHNRKLADAYYQKKDKMNTKTNIKIDIVQQQQQVIKELRQRVEYLESIQAEYQTFRGAFRTGETTFSQAMQTVLNAQNAVAQAERTRRDYELQSERSIAAAEREAELEKQVLSSHPDLIGRLEEGKKTLEKDTQERYKLTNRWFDMSGEDFQKYLTHSTNVNESPVSPIITVEEQNAAGSTVRKIKYFSCDVCYGSSYLSLDLIERHIFEEDHERHHEAVLTEINSDKSTKLVKLTADTPPPMHHFLYSNLSY
jgi:hypothetical protein